MCMTGPGSIGPLPPPPDASPAARARWKKHMADRKKMDAMLEHQRKQHLAWSIFAALIVLCAITALMVMVFGLMNFLAAVAVGLILYIAGDAFVRWIRKWL